MPKINLEQTGLSELIEAELKSEAPDLWSKKVFTKKKKGNDGH
jgi:hypothetical protein